MPLSSVTAQQGVPSLALAYLGAALKHEGYPVTSIDALGEKITTFRSFGVEGLLALGLSVEEIMVRVPSDVFLIGVSCQFSNDWIFAKKILQALSQNFPKAHIVCGGEHTTADFERILTACPFLLACILGEGEETLCELVETLSQETAFNKDSLQKIPGLAFLENSFGDSFGKSGKIFKTAPRRRKKDVDQLPWPNWDDLPLENYLRAGLGMAAQGIRTMPVLASRGCPFRCTFCSAPLMWDAKWYGRNVDDVIAEVKTYISKYKIQHVEFYDMSPSTNQEWLRRLVDRLADLNISWNFPSGMRIENLSADLLEKMRRAGCYKMTFALETSSPKLIKQLKKKVNPLKMLGLIRNAIRVGLVTKVNFIWGLPNQTSGDILRDYFFLFRLALLGLHDATCFAFVPYPGSEDFLRLSHEGQIPEGEDRDLFLAFNVYNNPLRMKSWSIHIKDWHMTYWTLGGMALFYSTQFLTRPWRFFQLFYRVFKERPLTMLELALHSLKNGFIKGRKRRAQTHHLEALEV